MDPKLFEILEKILIKSRYKVENLPGMVLEGTSALLIHSDAQYRRILNNNF